MSRDDMFLTINGKLYELVPCVETPNIKVGDCVHSSADGRVGIVTDWWRGSEPDISKYIFKVVYIEPMGCLVRGTYYFKDLKKIDHPKFKAGQVVYYERSDETFAVSKVSYNNAGFSCLNSKNDMWYHENSLIDFDTKKEKDALRKARAEELEMLIKLGFVPRPEIVMEPLLMDDLEYFKKMIKKILGV